MEIHSVGAELFHADGKIRTDRQRDRQIESHDEANSHFSQFCGRV